MLPNWSLHADEVLLWQGRPAPRCYLFRHFRSLLSAILVGVGAAFLLWWGGDKSFSAPVAVFPVLILLLSIIFGPVRLLYLRIRWESIYYAVTGTSILIRNQADRPAARYDLELLTKIVTHEITPRLADIDLTFRGGGTVRLKCLEHPESCLRSLPDRLVRETSLRADPV